MTAKDLVHQATRAASEQGACNLFHCAFDGKECCLPCEILQRMIGERMADVAAHSHGMGQQDAKRRPSSKLEHVTGCMCRWCTP